MKKSLIAAGAASVALAAMPIVGAFAASNADVTDTINLTVGSGCTITSGASNRNAVAISTTPGGAAQTADGDAIVLNCNTASWTMTAIGGTSATPNTTLTGAGAAIATGTATSGSTSNWAFKIKDLDTTSASNADIETGYNKYVAVPGTATTVVTGKATGAVSIQPSYQVYTAGGQATGAYSGTVTYTIAAS